MDINRTPGLGEEKERDGRKKAGQDNQWLSQGLVLFARFSSWVIAPVFIGIIAGKWLEKKSPANGQIIFLICVGLAFIISMAGLIIETTKEYKKILDDDAKKKDEKDKAKE